jgi:RNA polymerase sigma-70 factor (ECF subfamily)
VDSISDEAYWGRALAGEGDAFGVIFDRHRSRLYRHSRGLIPSLSDADDVVAITLFEAWRKRSSVRFVDGSILPWLPRTATYTARNHTRSAHRYRAALSRLPAQEHHPDHAQSSEDGDAITALRGLSLSDQQVITLCVLEGLDTAEAARVLDVRAGTVKSRLSRAKAKLRARLDPHSTPLLEGASDVL